MIQTRQNVFETNSSSTHSMVMCQDEDYKGWSEGKLYYCDYFPYDERVKHLEKKDSDFYTEEEVKEICKLAEIEFEPEEDDDWCERKDHFMTLDEFFDTEYLECEEQTFTTKSGETVHACYKYGYDG